MTEYIDLLAEHDRLKALNAELVEALEELFSAKPGLDRANSLSRARAVLDKARKEG